MSSDNLSPENSEQTNENIQRYPLVPTSIAERCHRTIKLLNAAISSIPSPLRWVEPATGEFCVRLRDSSPPWSKRLSLHAAESHLHTSLGKVPGIHCQRLALRRFPETPEEYREASSTYHLSPAVRQHLKDTKQQLAGWRNTVGFLPDTRRKSCSIIAKARLDLWKEHLYEFHEVLEERLDALHAHILQNRVCFEDFEREEEREHEERPCRRIVIPPHAGEVRCTLHDQVMTLLANGTIHLQRRSSRHVITLTPGRWIDGLSLHHSLSGFTVFLDQKKGLTIKKDYAPARLMVSAHNSKGSLVEWDIHTHDHVAMDQESENG